jgi:hypothetical protein
MQVAGTNAFNTTDKTHPIREELLKVSGTHSFEATFAIDTEMMNKFKEAIPGIVGIICHLKRDGKIVSEGRGTAALSKLNRSVERTTNFVHRSAFVDAIMRYTRILEALDTSGEIKQDGFINLDELFKDEEIIPATEKQKTYLLELVQSNVYSNEERTKWKEEINAKGFSKDDASTAIQSFIK